MSSIHKCAHCSFTVKINTNNNMDPQYVLDLIESKKWIINGFIKRKTSVPPIGESSKMGFIALTCPKCGQREFTGANQSSGWLICKSTNPEAWNKIIEHFNICKYCGKHKKKNSTICPQCGEPY